MVKIRVFNGPNLNLLGQREPGQYGQRSLPDIMQELETFADNCGVSLDHMQTNSEGAMVDAIQQAGSDGIDYIIINPAGYTHTSVAIRDALLAVRSRLLKSIYPRSLHVSHSGRLPTSQT